MSHGSPGQGIRLATQTRPILLAYVSMKKLIAIQTMHSILGGVMLLLGPLAAALWVVVGELTTGPLLQRAKSQLPAGTCRAKVAAIREAAFLGKMTMTNPAGLLSMGILAATVMRTPTTRVGVRVDQAVGTACVLVMVAAACCTWLALFPALTFVWMVIKDHYEWTGRNRRWTLLIPPLKLGGAAMFAAALRHDLFAPLFAVECLLVVVAVGTGSKANDTERTKLYLGRLAAVPLVALSWVW